ncbi:MAG: hypothetical protein ACRCZB_05990 [Bacteroidales bacterium]
MILKILNPIDKKKVIQYVESLSDTRKYIVEVKVKRERRSIEQNRLYWLWLTCIQDETGNDKETLHEFFKQHVLGVKTLWILDDRYSVDMVRSTTALDTKEMTDYLNRVQQFANVDLGIILPNPEDLHWEEFYNKYKNFI